MRHLNIDFGDGLVSLLDPLVLIRFADDLSLPALNQEDWLQIPDALINALSNSEIGLNASKSVVMTTAAPTPSWMWLTKSMSIRVMPRNFGHKWLGCMFSVGRSGGHNLETDFHLRVPPLAFFAYKSRQGGTEKTNDNGTRETPGWVGAL